MVADNLARTVNRLVADRAADSDADLLRRFVTARDDAAFTLIVRRHGPMVFGVCRRMLGHQQDAEDAFQAAFLVLARKAHTVCPDGLSRWLYGVAVRVANKARTRRSRRTPTPADLNEIPGRPAEPPNDWLPLVDAALARMSDRDRGPILLCDLLGRSRAEAAAELGVGEGTLSSGLARARAKLRVKLARLGVVPGVLTVAALAPETVPAALIESTRGAASTAARELADGVLRAMFLANVMKLSAAGVCMIGAAVGVVWLPAAGARPVPVVQEVPKPAPPAKGEPAKPDSDLARIQGTWVIETATGGTGRDNAAAWHLSRVVFDGSRVNLPMYAVTEQSFHLDPARDPKRIDFQLHNVARRARSGRLTGLEDETLPGIYKFDGDKLKLVVDFSELKERPDSFEEPKKDSPFMLLVLRRPTKEDIGWLTTNEPNSLKGTWVATTETTRGGPRPAPEGVKLVIKGDRLRFDAPVGTLHASFTLNLAAEPRQIDLTASADWGAIKKGTLIPGIYGHIGYVLRLALGTSARPASFDAAAREGTVYTFVREDHLGDIKAAPAPAKKTDPAGPPENKRLRELQTERVRALEAQLRDQFERVKIGVDQLSTAIGAAQELADAEKDLAETKEGRVAAVQKLVKTLTEYVDALQELLKAGLQTQVHVLQAKAALLKAEIELEKLKESK
jgi:RNA polymerase sigma factor (sigma-70 family)